MGFRAFFDETAPDFNRLFGIGGQGLPREFLPRQQAQGLRQGFFFLQFRQRVCRAAAFFIHHRRKILRDAFHLARPQTFIARLFQRVENCRGFVVRRSFGRMKPRLMMSQPQGCLIRRASR